MKKYSSYFKTTLNLALTVFSLALFGHQAFAQTTIAKWTFETLPSALSYVPGAGVSTTNYLADFGTQAGIAAASGKHSGYGTPTYSSPAGNGSARALSSNGWTNNPGDYYQFVVNTVGFTNINLVFDAVGSGTGPRDFKVMYSTDGVTFTQFATYTVLSSPTWSAGTPQVGETYTFDLSSITALANASVVYIRLVDNSNTSIGGGLVGTAGTSRIDNVVVAGTIAGPPQIITQPKNTTNYFGDTVTLTLSAGGDSPLSVQWYYPNLSTPLADGSSGYGSGTISGSTAQTLTLTFVNTNQAGNYQVIVSNSINTVTSVVAHLTVNVRPAFVTNIAYLHTLHDANFVLTDTTNLYTVEGNVTTIGDLVSGTTEVESFFVQDGTGGVDVFFRGGFPFPNFGDHVRITAPLLQFNGVLEMAPINGNPAHSVEILGPGTPPAPQYFSFTTLPSPTVMEESIEGRYLVISNVFLGITNADLHLVGNEIIFMTNLTGQVFHMIVANNPLLGPPGNFLPGPFATSVTGVMSQTQTSGTVLTNGYNIILSDFSQITVGTPPVIVNPIPLNIQLSGANVVLTWSDASFNLQSSAIVTGPYTTISGAASPFTTNTISAQQFFRLIHP
jgi:hypothetical protein